MATGDIKVLDREPKTTARIFRDIGHLRRQYETAMRMGAEATMALLKFAHSYSQAWRALNEAGGSEEERDDRIRRLDEKIGIDQRSDAWRSSIRSIGRATWLQKLINCVPQSVDSLAFLSRKGEQKCVPLLRAGDITAGSSIADTRAACGADTRAAGGKKKRVVIAIRTTYDGTLSFTDKAEACRVFEHILRTTGATLAVSDTGVFGALKDHFGTTKWARVKDRVSIASR